MRLVSSRIVKTIRGDQLGSELRRWNMQDHQKIGHIAGTDAAERNLESARCLLIEP